MNKKIEITKERLEQLEGFERIVQTMKDNGFNTFKSVKEFLQDHEELKDILQVVLNEWKENRWILQSDEDIKKIENCMKQAEQLLKESR